MSRKIFLLVLCLFIFTGCMLTNAKKMGIEQSADRVVLGIARVAEPEVKKLLEGKRLGLFTNQTGIDSQLRSSVDIIREQYNLSALFVPEHGLFGAVTAGEKFNDSQYHGIPVFSLYGSTRRPSKEMLASIDAMVVDIQDVGVRHYTYFSSLAYIMETCAKFDKQVVVLDRPNPLGDKMQGPVLKPEYATFIGLYSIPLRHGLTIGEFARYINKEEGINCKLDVVTLKIIVPAWIGRKPVCPGCRHHLAFLLANARICTALQVVWVMAIYLWALVQASPSILWALPLWMQSR